MNQASRSSAGPRRVGTDRVGGEVSADGGPELSLAKGGYRHKMYILVVRLVFCPGGKGHDGRTAYLPVVAV